MQDKSTLENGLQSLRDLAAPIELTYHPASSETPFARQLKAFATKIGNEGGSSIAVLEGDGRAMLAQPGLTLGYRGQNNINYLAVPDGPEAPPFFEALIRLGKGSPASDDGLGKMLQEIGRPAELLVFIAPTCPHCPGAVRIANRIALLSNNVKTTIIDVQQFPKLAEPYSVQSVPLTVLDGQLSITGIVQAETLVSHILSRDSDEFDTRVFQLMVEEGRLNDAKDQIRKGNGSVHFVSLWEKSTTALRIGLLMLAEETLDEDNRALDGIIPRLFPLLRSEDAALRGDTVDLLSQIGHESAIKEIEPLFNDPNPDVAEIAEEALEEIKSRLDE